MARITTRPLSRRRALRLLALRREELAPLGLRSLALFGSVARDQAGPGSDVDVVVEFEGPPTFDRYVDLLLALERILQRPVDLVTRRSLAPPRRQRIDAESVHVPGFGPLAA